MRFLRAVKSWAGGVVISLDQLGNALLFGFADETLSSRLGRRIKRLRGKDPVSNAACAVLDALEKDHCAISIEENPDGSTDAHHLGRVIRELPPDPVDVLRRARRGAGE